MKSDAVPMSEEQRFLFDLKGWLLVPGALEDGEIEEMREHLRLVRDEPEKLAPEDRFGYAGPVSRLHDHPAVVGILRSIIASDVSENAYGFRLDGNYAQHRMRGDVGIAPHGGGPRTGLNAYQCRNQKIYSALTRVVWELNEVESGKGGTLLMSGSHKSNFKIPEAHMKVDSPLFENYSCPPGSILFFTENLCHSGAAWSMAHPRIAVFNCYTHHQAQFHRQMWNAPTIKTWPAKRQTLVRGVWAADFHNTPTILNDWYGEDNRAY